MSERILENPSRDDVINAWKPISAQGFGDPAEVEELISGKPKSPEIIEAENLYNAWFTSGKEEASSRTPEEELKFQFDTTMLYVDAGFTGSDYLDEVANDWLVQDAQVAEDQGFTELAAQINAKIDAINNQLDNN